MFHIAIFELCLCPVSEYVIYAACLCQKTANAALTRALKRSNTYAETIIIVSNFFCFQFGFDASGHAILKRFFFWKIRSTSLNYCIHAATATSALLFLLNRLCSNQVENGCNEPRILTKNSFASFNISNILKRRDAGTKCVRDDVVLCSQEARSIRKHKYPTD